MTTRPAFLNGVTIRSETACGALYVTVNLENGKIREVFCNLGKAGTCAKAMTELVGRLLSISLKRDADVKKIVQTIKGIQCHSSNEHRLSCANAIALVL
jgi:ribonucleoside-diphosphate reductase alpha chain